MVVRRRQSLGTSRFPIERSEDYKGTITFRPVRYTPPEVSGGAFSALRRRGGGGSINQFLNSSEETALGSAIEGFREATGGGESNPDAADPRGRDQIPALDPTPTETETLVTSATSTVDRNSGVILYLPSAIQVNDGVNYEQFDLGPIGAIGLAGIQSGQGAPSALARGIGQATGSLASLLSGNVADQRGARLAAARLAEQGNATTAGAVRAGLATTVNPNTINLFKSVNLREFSFTFKMIANSPREAEEIDRIVRFFRATMYPETINFDPGGLDVPIGYEFPDKFQIEMRYNGQPVGVRILNSVLRSVQTVYNPQSMSWHVDGKPSEVDVTLNFGEERALNRNDILQGY